MSRYTFSAVRTNRHKTNKVRDVSDRHLLGRLALLELDLEELGDQFPHISAKIATEIKMIKHEMRVREQGGPRPVKEAPVEVIPEWDDPQSLFALEDTAMLEDFSETEG
jgi:hypothetical protein